MKPITSNAIQEQRSPQGPEFQACPHIGITSPMSREYWQTGPVFYWLIYLFVARDGQLLQPSVSPGIFTTEGQKTKDDNSDGKASESESFCSKDLSQSCPSIASEPAVNGMIVFTSSSRSAIRYPERAQSE
jgi:hypothetical protein